MRRPFPLALVLLACVGCQQAVRNYAPAGGTVLPTVEGGPVASYPDLETAKQAFTRSAGSLTATLEDAAWIKLEPDPAGAELRHRAYFRFGYTSFEVVLRSDEFSQPAKEEFLLEDSLGGRSTGRPLTYEGAMKLEDNQWFANRFQLAFSHVLTKDVKWLRLTRTSDGSQVEWVFGEPCAPAPGCVR